MNEDKKVELDEYIDRILALQRSEAESTIDQESEVEK